MNWYQVATSFVELYARTNKHQFLVEDIIDYCYNKGLPRTEDKRYWGPVIRKAAKEGFIVRLGTASAKTSNHSPKYLWKSVI